MGLDMYAYTTTRKIPDIDFGPHPDDVLICYWRKHPNLHGWMEKKWRKKIGWFRLTPRQFNLEFLRLNCIDLFALEVAIREDKLPETTGFFFGQSRPGEKERDLEFIRKARAALASGQSVYYMSSW